MLLGVGERRIEWKVGTSSRFAGGRGRAGGVLVVVVVER